MLDAIISPDWEFRYYSFNSHWNTEVSIATMLNGSGDHIFLVFTQIGAIVKGFAHESPMSPYINDLGQVWPNVLDQVPEPLAVYLKEPAFLINETTFCIWRSFQDATWKRGVLKFPESDNPDGSKELLSILDGNPLTYQTWAESYYEQKISVNAVDQVYKHCHLTQSLVSELNPDISLQMLAQDIEEIGYPNSLAKIDSRLM
ncbi:MAG: hypothetical protein RM368_32775 [Nostoc sp. DedSLP03]|nr:hypothetical protein [Nostoc sp. DedSLP03]